jgi:hypothetical protein
MPHTRLVIKIAVILCAVPLLIYAYQGTCTRLVADDYCAANQVTRFGYLGAQEATYMTWSGRYSATALQSALVSLSPSVVPYVTPAILLLWLAALTWFWSALTRRVSTALLLAEITLGATLFTLPDIAHSLFWLTGSPAYIVPLILWPLLAHPRVRWAVLAPLAFLAGGFSETALILQMTIFVGAAILDGQRRGRHALVCAGTLASLAAVALAPGNAVRQAYFPPPPGLGYIARTSLQFAWDTFVAFCTRSPGPAAALASGFLVAQARAREAPGSYKWLLAWLLLPAGVLFPALSAAPALWAMSGLPPARALAPAVFSLVCLFACVGYVVGRRVGMPRAASRVGQVAGAAAVVFLVGSGAWSTLHDLASWRSFARDWARQDVAIRTGGPIPVISTPYGPDTLSTDPEHWVNQCMGIYYGVSGLCASEP